MMATMSDGAETSDPVLEQRARLREVASKGQRAGYACYAVATVAFVFGLVTELTSGLVWTIGALLIVGSIILAVAIQLGYAIRGAERHEEDSAAQRRRR